jgi:hypothetical protein
MEKKSTEKLLNAGYTFLRVREIQGKPGVRTTYAIMQSKEFGSWTLLEKCETKAACRRRLKELEEQPLILW